MAATQVRLSSLTDGVRAALSGVGGFPAADVHDGVVESPSLIAGTNLIQPYAVVWLGPGDEIDRVVGGATGGGEHRLYVTVAASTQGKCLDAVDRARRILDGAWLSLSGHQVGIRWLEGYYSQPAQRDPVAPSDRWYVPLIFTALI